MSLIFLGGPPGAGKSSAVATVVARRPGTVVANAGALIREARNIGTWGERPAVADAATTKAFQKILLAQVAVLRQRANGPIVLDGHFAVPTGQGPVSIAPDVFQRLGCIALIHLSAPVTELAERLRTRGGAAWWDGSDEQVAALAEADRYQAMCVSAATRIPLSYYQSPDAAARQASDLLAERGAAVAGPARTW